VVRCNSLPSQQFPKSHRWPHKRRTLTTNEDLRQNNKLSSACGDLIKMLNLIHAIAAEPLVIARKSVLVSDDVWFIKFCTRTTP